MKKAPATVIATLTRGQTYRLHDTVFRKGVPEPVTAEVAAHLGQHAVDYVTMPDSDPTPEHPADPAFPRRVAVAKFTFAEAAEAV